MHRIIRTALASVGAAVVVAGGSLGVAYATTPTPDPTKASSSSDSDQVAALNKEADDLLAKISTLEQQLASNPTPTSTPSELTKDEVAETTGQTSYTSRASGTIPASAAAPAASSSQRTDETDSQTGGDHDD